MEPDDGRVVSNFIVQALQNKDITIFGDGMQTRSFQYVTDLVDGMVRMMNTPDDFTGPVNIGNPGEFTILLLAKEILEITGSRSKIIYLPLPEDDPIQRQTEITLAREKLGGWEPVVPLREGLEKTVDYFDKLLAAEKN